MKIAFAGSFAARFAEPVRARLALPCEVIVDDEVGIVPRLSDVDVLVSMGFSKHMAEAAPRLRLVQVPGAGLDRIDCRALRPHAKCPEKVSRTISVKFTIGTNASPSENFSPGACRKTTGTSVSM